MEQAPKRQKCMSLREQTEAVELLVKGKSYDVARKEAEAALTCLQCNARAAISSLPDLARILVVRGKAILYPLVHRLPDSNATPEHESIVQATLEEARAAFELAWRLHPQNTEAKELDEFVMKKLSTLEEFMQSDDATTSENGDDKHDVAHVEVGSEVWQPLVHHNIADASTDDAIRPRVEMKDVKQAHVEQLGVKDDLPVEASNRHSSGTQLTATPQQDCNLPTSVDSVDVVVVGAGAAGIGVAVSLVDHFGVSREQVQILERGAQIGESFRRWPKEMRFISPSFNQQTWTQSFDLNSVAYGTSPASFLGEEHPSGEQYAKYLEYVASETCLNVHFNTEVLSVTPIETAPKKLEFELHLRVSHAEPDARLSKVLRCKYVVWAAGEFQYPKKNTAFPGSEFCLHNSEVSSWQELPGRDFVVVGGYESGLDATVHLARAGRNVTVVASKPFWEVNTSDPSTELAPFTRDRLREVTRQGFPNPPKLYGGLRVTKVEHIDNQYLVHTEPQPQQEKEKPDDAVLPDVTAPQVFHTSSPPILGIGFEGSVANLVASLFEWSDQPNEDNVEDEKQVVAPCRNTCAAGSPVLTEEDESTKTEGLFLVGPSVRHRELVFCFIYKFRQRFAVVAESIARRLGRRSGKELRNAVEACRKMDMFLDDLSNIEDCSEEGCC